MLKYQALKNFHNQNEHTFVVIILLPLGKLGKLDIYLQN